MEEDGQPQASAPRTPEQKLEVADISLCLPLVLILNFSLFQYLVTTFWKRRQENRVRLLLFLAFLSFAALVPFAYPDKELMRNLNDISEVCSILTFLLQIVILSRDVGKRIKIKSIWVLMWVGEVLVVLSMCVLITNILDVIAPVIDMDLVEELDLIVENASLLFIVGFRFYFLAMIKGFRKVVATQKWEILWYCLFLSHSWPFHVLDATTGYSWHHVQGVWMRITIAACLSSTIKARLTSNTSKMGPTNTTHGPHVTNFNPTTNNNDRSSFVKPSTDHDGAAGGKGPRPTLTSVKSLTTVVPQPKLK